MERNNQSSKDCPDAYGVDWSDRIKKLRTKAGHKLQSSAQARTAAGTMGLSKDSYWKSQVKCIDDVVRYYQLYYPEYPDQLCQALALRIEELKNGDLAKQPVDFQKKMLRKYADKKRQEEGWDIEGEIKAQYFQGKMAASEKALQELSLDSAMKA